ncbi:MAG: SDR family oxidoreductase [Salaquimonas sp.]|nr:SDR family oxidoreductase [Salaquimonas sp.]
MAELTMDLGGKHALVTGGGTGVGAAIALSLAQAGAKVTITGRHLDKLEEVAAGGSSISCVSGDVTDPTSVREMFAEATARNGAPQIVVANAGAAMSKPFAKMDEADLRAMLDVNLVGVFSTWRAALDPMLAAGWGRLIVIASIASLKGSPYISAYCASKHGVLGMTRALALEVARKGITVNAVCPGYIATPMTDRTIANIAEKTGKSRDEAEDILKSGNPQHRLIEPEEVAETVRFLCSDAASSINGQAITLSGGEP